MNTAHPRRRLLSALAVLALTVSACSGDDDSAESEASTQPPPSDTTTTAAPADTTATGATASTTTQVPEGDVVCTEPASEFRVGVVLAAVGDGGALNEALGLPSVAQQQDHFEAVIGDVNADGGPACHEIVPVFQAFNYVDPASTQSQCLDFIDEEVEAMLGGYQATSTNACPLENQIAVFDNGGSLLPSEIEDNFPYYFGVNIGVTYRNFADAAADAGYFSTLLGDGKIGLVHRDCVPERVDLLRASLSEVGVDDDRLSTFSLGCPAAFPTPASLQQAVLQFIDDGVTVLISIADSDVAALSAVAEEQGFQPHWAMPDNSIIATTISPDATKPDPANFDGAFVVTGSRYGEDPATVDDDLTAECDAIMAAAGLPSVADSPAHYAGAACDYVWVLAAAIENADDPSAESLADGLRQAGSVPLSFPAGPNDFDHDLSSYGNGAWRVVRYDGSCSCWNVPDLAFNPPR